MFFKPYTPTKEKGYNLVQTFKNTWEKLASRDNPEDKKTKASKLFLPCFGLIGNNRYQSDHSWLRHFLITKGISAQGGQIMIAIRGNGLCWGFLKRRNVALPITSIASCFTMWIIPQGGLCVVPNYKRVQDRKESWWWGKKGTKLRLSLLLLPGVLLKLDIPS